MSDTTWWASSVPVIRSECRCGAVIEGLGASAHAWGKQHHTAECGGKGK